MPCDYWQLVGSATPVLGNVLVAGGTTVKQMALQTNMNTRVRIFEDGRIQVRPVSGTIPGGLGQGDAATVKIHGGDFSGLACTAFHTGDWGQNIQSIVGRQYTVSYVVNYAGHDRFYVAGAGWLYANGAWFSSDRKLKEDIKPIKSALAKVLKLKGVTYRPIQEGKAKKKNAVEMGLIAQDVERVVPESVRTMNDGVKTVAYQNMVPLLIEAIKEQQKVIDKQGKDISALKLKLSKK
jgi:hypothetical protein